MAARLIFLILCISLCNTEPVRKKICKNAENTHCSIHSVNVDPCPDGPGFCLLRRGKPSTIAVDYTPRFSANHSMVAISADVAKTGSFESEILAPTASCEGSDCAIEENTKSQLNVNFSFDKKTHGKFPVQVKLWNADDETQSCCFTFNVRMLKSKKNKA